MIGSFQKAWNFSPVALSVASASLDQLVRDSNPIVTETFIFYNFWNQIYIFVSKFDLYKELLDKTFDVGSQKLPGLEYS